LAITTRGGEWAQPTPVPGLLGADYKIENGRTALRDI
jgi:hypothetical protein